MFTTQMKKTFTAETYQTYCPSDVFPQALAEAKITEILAYRINLPINRITSPFEKILVHQFVLVKTAEGHLLTIEKLPTCILAQTAHCSNISPETLKLLRVL